MALRLKKLTIQSPLALALQHVVETRRLIDRLITSSESFDYTAAKLALEHLTAKRKELGRLEQLLASELTAQGSSCAAAILPFDS